VVSNLKDKARGCLLGLAVGDALGSPTEGKTPSEIFSKWGRVTDFLSEDQTGSDDTEYALFNAKLLLEQKGELTSKLIADAWRKEIISDKNAYKGAGFSEIIAIHNLQKGLEPPATGMHAHSWSDGLAMRVAPFGIVSAGNHNMASHLAKIDGCISHSGEGIFAGQAVAAAIASAMMEDSLQKIFDDSLSVIPTDSWTHSAITNGIIIGKEQNNVWSSLELLHNKIACEYYHWTDVAPEAAGLAFGLVAASNGNFEEAVLGAVNIGRDTDTIAAIAGAVCGALNGESSIPKKWRDRISVARGICINSVKDINILFMADKLAMLAEEWSTRDE